MRRSGQPGAPTTFTSYPGETAIVDGQSAVAYTVTVVGAQDVALSHLIVQGGYADAHEGGGVVIEASTRVSVSDSLLRDNKAFGVRSQKSTYVTIERNEVTHNAVGVHIGELGEGTVVANNLIHDNDKMMVNTPDIQGDDVGAGGVTLVETTGNVVVRNNYVWGNRALSYDYGYDGSAFEIFAAQNWTFTDNVAWDNRVVFETGTDAARTPCSNGVFTYNTAFGPATVDVARGVVLRCAERADRQQHVRRPPGLRLHAAARGRNLRRLDRGPAHHQQRHGPDHREGLQHRQRYPIVRRPRREPGLQDRLRLPRDDGRQGRNELARDAWPVVRPGPARDPGGSGFVDAAAHDYRLEPGSPAIDSGVVIPGVTDTYLGAGPDRGSAESTP